MNFIMIGLLLREALDRLRVRLNNVSCCVKNIEKYGGASYVRWGRKTCDGNATLLYEGELIVIRVTVTHTVPGNSEAKLCYIGIT